MTLYLGLDIGGTKSAAVVGDEHGTVLARASAIWEGVQIVPAALGDAIGQSGDGCRIAAAKEFFNECLTETVGCVTIGASPDNLRLCMGLPE